MTLVVGSSDLPGPRTKGLYSGRHGSAGEDGHL